MKRIFILILTAVIAISCSNDDDSSNTTIGIEGNWKLTAVLMDPGDGSGTFQPLNSTTTISFDGNGMMSSNSNFCGTSTSGTYDETTQTITTPDCEVTYEINGSYLEITFFCIEPCKERYERI